MSPKKYEVSFFNSKYVLAPCFHVIRSIQTLTITKRFLPSVKHALFLFQGGREVSDFLSYLKREATNAPIVQEETKKKKKKKVEL